MAHPFGCWDKRVFHANYWHFAHVKWHNVFWFSAEDVPENVFEGEESLDDSDSKCGEDIYGYLGAIVVPRGELEDEMLLHLCEGPLEIDHDDEVSNKSEGKLNKDFCNEWNEPSLMECDDDGRGRVMQVRVQDWKIE